MRNQRGIAFPMVLIFAAVFLMALTAAVDIFITEKKFYYESAEKLKADYILRLGVNEILEMIAKKEQTAAGFLFYLHGDLFYEINKEGDYIHNVHVYISTKQNRKMEAIFKYDSLQQKMIEWIEI
ncbi:competence type IV pilus minor pilin ComGG [Peribacillus deserti]|uniref:Competence protein ComG n=1 Tax=Peribacillus deserti TaxID=673318 RepID=A0A2N5M489_9BACI|nr:competence type IV pilus minor pilin ComGG [Peribacillus deserti]PLT29179.1 hypothetical protein CUU66_14635 [Peribacillus deserti]